MTRVLKPFVLVCIGSSLTTGRLAGPDLSWVPLLARELPDAPEALGPVRVYNMGKGSQNSAWGVTQIDAVTALRPTHILMEGFAINDCIDSGGGAAISRAAHIANITSMVTSWQAQIPGVDITIQTMSPVSPSGAGVRPLLGTYYADEVATAAALGVRILDNYAAWPKPLDPTKTASASGLALPVTAGYLYQNGVTWNPADKAASVSLSPDLLTATATATSGWVRATAALAGTIHFEVTVGAIAHPHPSVGVATSAMGGGYVGGVAGTCGLLDDGNVWLAGAFIGAAGFTFSAGDIIGVEVDVPNSRIYFLKGAARSAGFNIASLTGAAIYPAISLISSTVSGKFTPEGDGLHPLFVGALDTWLYPAVKTWARARMAEVWVPPANSVLPLILGPPYRGALLTSTPGVWSAGPRFTYQWLRDFAPIAAATYYNYTPVAGDVGHVLRLQVTAANDVGAVIATSLPTAVITVP